MSSEQVLDSLRQTYELYSELTALALQKKDQVIHNRLNDITATVGKESKLLKRLAEADRSTTQAVLAYQLDTGLKPDPNASLREIIVSFTRSADKREAEQLRLRLTEAAASLKSLNEQNQLLIRHAMDMVEHSLDLLVGAPEQEAVYRKPTSPPAGDKRRGLFDTKG